MRGWPRAFVPRAHRSLSRNARGGLARRECLPRIRFAGSMPTPNLAHSRRQRTERALLGSYVSETAVLVERDALIAARFTVRPVGPILRQYPLSIGALFVIVVNVPLLGLLFRCRVVRFAFRHVTRSLGWVNGYGSLGPPKPRHHTTLSGGTARSPIFGPIKARLLFGV